MSLKFAKGSSSGSYKRTPDTLRSNDTVEALIGISEGPTKGPVDGPKSLFLDDTPLVNPGTGQPNFQNFRADFYPGSPLGHTIGMALGGFSSPITVGTSLASGVPVARNGVQLNVDAIDFRIVVNQLMRSDKKGVFPTTLSLLFEWKKESDATWTPAWISEAAPVWPATPDPNDPTSPSNGTEATYEGFGGLYYEHSFPDDQYYVPTTGAPTDPPEVENTVAYDGPFETFWHFDRPNGVWVQATTSDEGDYTYVVNNVTNRPTRVFKQIQPPFGNLVVGDTWKYGATTAVWNGVSWVDRNAPAPVVASNGVWSINAKVSSATPKDIRVFLPEPSDEPLEFRVTKTSPDGSLVGDVEVVSSVSWESVQEIQRRTYTFENLSLLKYMGQASDQFTSLPNMNGDYEGRIVKVPSNYNEVARTYSGVWDGTYKLAYTNNTAFIFQDFVENDTYGLSTIFPHTVNKWKIYEWGVWCDDPVLRPDGSTRPRWTYNDYMMDAADARERAQMIAGTAAARYVDDGNGIVDIIIDRDDPAVALFTQENVGPDGFRYSYTDRQSRANQVIGKFINPNLNDQEDGRIARDEDDIATYGLIPETILLVGCTDEDEAMARIRRRLIGGLTEKEFVTFDTNRKGLYLSEWDVVLVADPEMGRGLTGRIRATTGGDSVSLRDPITLEPGFEYWATFDVPDPTDASAFKTERRKVSSAAGTHTSLTFDEDLPELAEYAVFSLECDGLVGMPKPYRVVRIDDDSGSGEFIQITGLELNRNKFTFIDTAVDIGEVEYSNFEKGKVLPPSDPVLEPFNDVVGGFTVRRLRLTWTKSRDPFVRRYKVTHFVNSEVVQSLEVTEPLALFDAVKGNHRFLIRAVNMAGRESDPVIFNYDVTGDFRTLEPPRNLRLVGGLTGTTYDIADPSFEWDPPVVVDPNFSHYRVRVISTENVVLRTTDVGSALSWTYAFGDQSTDTLRRSFQLAVSCVDQFEFESGLTILTVSNAAPAAPTVALEGSIAGINVILSAPPERDVTGAFVWISDTDGFNPAITTPIAEGDQQLFFIPLVGEHPRYVRAAYYDIYGQTGLNYSIQHTITPELLSTSVAEIIEEIEEAREQVNNVWDVIDAINEALINGSDDLLELNDRFEDLTHVDGESLKAEYIYNREIVQDELAASASEIEGLHAQLNTPDTGLEARFVSFQEVTVNALEEKATATSVEELSVDVDDLSADFIDYQTLVADALAGKASASSLVTLSSTVSDLSADFTSYQTTVADALAGKASTTALTTLSSTVSDLSADFTSYQTTVADALAGKASTTALSSLSSTVSTLSSSFTTYQTTVSDALAGKASTTDLTTLSTTVGGHTSTLSTLSAVSADLEGRTQAYHTIEAFAGAGATAFISARAETAPGVFTSNVGIGARTVSIYNSIAGAWRKVIDVSDGRVAIDGDLRAAGRIQQGPGAAPTYVAMEPFSALAGHGEPVSYASRLFFAAPIVTVDVASTTALSPLTAGEAYDIRATSVTASGFTPHVQIITPGTPTGYSQTSASVSGSGGTYWVAELDMPDASDAVDGNYTVAVSGTVRMNLITASPPDNWQYYGEVSVDVIFWTGSAFMLAGTFTLSAYEDLPYDAGAYVVGAFSGDGVVSFGDPVPSNPSGPDVVIQAGGGYVESFSFGAFSYTGLTSTGARTPTGKVKFIIQPRNAPL